MLVKIWVNGVLHLIPDVISIELMVEGDISDLYITTENGNITKFYYEEVEHIIVKKVIE